MHGRITEMDLFHGTGCNQPMEIVCSEDGLDVRHSCKGSWGYAIYLAETASYANQFAHKLSSGESEILIVKALVGEACDCGNKRNQQLKYPPIRHTKLNAVRYDSVSGVTKDTRVYIMFYENNKVYPTHLVRYTCPS